MGYTNFDYKVEHTLDNLMADTSCITALLDGVSGSYDIDAIVDEVTEVDHETNRRYWLDIDENDFWDSAMRHATHIVQPTPRVPELRTADAPMF